MADFTIDTYVKQLSLSVLLNERCFFKAVVWFVFNEADLFNLHQPLFPHILKILHNELQDKLPLTDFYS